MFDFSYFPSLKTERLVLNRIRADDVQALLDLFGDPDVTRHNDIMTFKTRQDAVLLMKFIEKRFQDQIGLRWAVRLRSAQSKLIGTAGYNSWDRQNFCGEIGYDLLPFYWGRGLMPEALRAVIGFGFQQMGLNRVEADVVTDNQASVRVLQKLGFTEEGVLRQRGVWKGAFHDLRLFSVLRQEWQL
jgi:[ribosomal protein S5]-alanine N-acetyltransferase